MEFLIGCILGIMLSLSYAYVNVDQKDMASFQTICEKNGGVEKIRLDVLGKSEATCKDGARFTLKEE